MRETATTVWTVDSNSSGHHLFLPSLLALSLALCSSASAQTVTVSGSNGQWASTCSTNVIVPSCTGVPATLSDFSQSNWTFTNAAKSGVAIGTNFGTGTAANGTASVTGGATVATDYVYLGYDNNATGALTISGSGSKWTAANQLIVGNNGTGTLLIEDGGLIGGAVGASPYFWAGYGTTGTGTITVTGVAADGTRSTFASPNQTHIGEGGNGTLNVMAGALATSQFMMTVGELATGVGLVNIDGVDATTGDRSTLHVINNLLWVGDSGTGTIHITDGGLLDVQDSVDLGADTHASGLITVDGVNQAAGLRSTLQTDSTTVSSATSLVIGDVNQGEIDVTNGGLVSTPLEIDLGENTGATGVLKVDGFDQASGFASTVTTAAQLYVGYFGTGTLNVTNGGVVNVGQVGYIGYHGAGTATISGSDGHGHASTWTDSSDLVIGQVATGTLNITDGGAVSDQTGYLGGNPGSQGTVTVSGSSSDGLVSTWLNAVQLRIGDQGAGTVNILAGGLVTVGGISYLGNNLHSAGTVTVSGSSSAGLASTWNSASDLIVGDQGTGTVNILAGGVVTVGGTSYVGNQASGIGTVTVSGTDGHGHASTFNTPNSDLVFGQDGSGTLNITGGGLVSNQNGYVGADGIGTATISGSSSDGLVSTWSNAGQLIVGDDGTGTLNILAGGMASSALGTIGNQATGNGTVLVSGNDGNGHVSTWTSATQLFVGNFGTGALTIADGGRVISDQGDIGFEPGSSGTVVVTGTDGNGRASTWTPANNLYVGLFGNGALTVADGGVVSTSGAGGGAAVIDIGTSSGTTGTVTVSSSTADVSTLSATGSIAVGEGGDGTLTIAKGGLVSAGSDTYVTDAGGSTGTLNLLGDSSGQGALETGSVINGNGAGILNIDGGILRATRDEPDFLSGFPALILGSEGAWFDTNGFDIGVDTNFSGAGGFNKLGLGTLTLTGINSYTGQTEIVAGELQVAAGGQINSTVMALVDGGGLTVTGAGSAFTTSGDLLVGRGVGTASVTVADGGQLTTGRSFIGEGGTVTTVTVLTATVTGPGSVWDAGDGFFLGAAHSSASLTISNGGVMRAQSALSDSSIGANGVAVATVTDANSQLVVGGSTPLTIGELPGGAGALTITNGGSVIAPTVLMGAFDPGASGTLNLDGTPGAQGVLQTASLTRDAGSARVNFDGGLLRATADNAAFLSGFAPGSITIGAGGAFIDSNGFAITAASDMNGAGALTKESAGTLTLTGTNGYTGGTTILAGTLVGAAGSLGTGTILDNAGLVIDQPVDAALPGAIDGNGTFLKEGAGRLNLTGGGNLSGPTSVAAGLLSVNGALPNSAVTVQNGGTLGGNGSVGATIIQSGGVIAPGNSIGTLHINGAFVQGASSIYQVQVDPNSTASDLILVDGAASIADGAGLTVAKYVPGGYRPGTQYTVLSATGGVTGEYALMGDTTASAYLTVQEAQDANNIYLRIIQTGDPATAAQTPNQTGVAGSLQSGSGAATAVLNTPDPGATRAAFDQLSGEALASAKGALVSGSVLVRDTTFDRLRDVLCAPDDGTNNDTQSVRHDCSDRPSLWTQGFGNWGNISGNGNAAGLTQATGGFLIGADIPVYDWRIGYFGGFSRTDFNVKTRASSGASNNYHLGAYAGTGWGDLSLRLGAAYSWSGIDTNRSVTIGDYSDQLHGFTNAGTTQLFGELGQRFLLDTITFEPFANLAYVNLRTDGFSETGGDAALTAQASTQEDGFSTLGVRPSSAISWSGLDILLRGMAGWRHTFGDVTPNSVVSFAGGNSFTVEGAPIARDAGVVEAGLDFAVRGNVTAGLTYGGQFSSGETDNGVRGTLAIAF